MDADIDGEAVSGATPNRLDRVLPTGTAECDEPYGRELGTARGVATETSGDWLPVLGGHVVLEGIRIEALHPRGLYVLTRAS